MFTNNTCFCLPQATNLYPYAQHSNIETHQSRIETATPDWLEQAVSGDWSRQESLAVDRWLDYLDREFRVGGAA